jgi:tRNA(Ile)-lysidine synthase
MSESRARAAPGTPGEAALTHRGVFSPQALAQRLGRFPATQRYLIAFSGGPDSTSLVGALASLRDQGPLPSLVAVHIDHRLHRDSRHWVEHCREVCARLAVPFRGAVVDARPRPGESPEAAAREARYRALRGCMAAEDIVLTAHHADDQAETLLLHLLRGAGPRGLAAMPELARWGPGWLGRPLLSFTRAELLAYARTEGLPTLDDPGNRDLRFDRNFLRRRVLPVMAERWPSAVATLTRAGRQQARSGQLLDELAGLDAAAVLAGDGALALTALRRLPPVRQANLIRFWLRGRHLPVPSEAQLERLLADLLQARADAQPAVRWPGVEVRRYRDRIYAMPPFTPVDPNLDLAWDLAQPLTLPDGNGWLVAEPGPGGLAPARCEGQGLRVRYRQGGERCRPAGATMTRPLKKLLQEAAVPPWQRWRWPLLFCADRLVAVAGLWVCEPFAAPPSAVGMQLRWHHAPPRADQAWPSEAVRGDSP